MPYYNRGNLILAGEPSDLSARLEEIVRSAPAAASEAIAAVYGGDADRLTTFADSDSTEA